MYKIIAVDLDGTLLNSYGEVEQYTKEVINKVREKGVKFIIASGRPIESIKTIAKEINSDEFMIAGNGALIYDDKKEEIIYEKYLSKSKILEIIKICEENSISYSVYTEKTILAKALKHNVLYYHKENLNKNEDKKTKINIVQDMYEYVSELENDNFIKITVCDEMKSVFNSVIKKLRNIQGIEVLDVSHMSRKVINYGTEVVDVEYFYTEISLENVDKWYAIEFLINKLGIKKEEVIAIGDNINDKVMIENAGLGIVMDGSTPAISEIANYITEGNNENGVGKAIEKYVLNCI